MRRSGLPAGLFFLGGARALRLWASAWVSPWRERRRLAGTLLVVLAWPVFCLLQLVHWIGFGVDEIFFRGWRKVDVRAPLFVLGPPRSGTTHLHHVLSGDGRTTTFRLWECLFGLSVSARKLLLTFGRLDRAVGRPADRFGQWLGRRFLGAMEDVHPFALDAPEEDFLALMPIMQCFVLVAVFPRAGWLWQSARLDLEASPLQRRRLMAFYKACVQKHLYVFGPDHRFVSKNASFSGMPEALLETFPDARIMACTRDPKQTVPSQLSSLKPALTATGLDPLDPMFRDRIVDLLKFYYLHLDEAARRHPDRIVVLDNQALHNDLYAAVKQAFQVLQIDLTPQFLEFLRRADSRSRGFQSGHRYTLAEFGLTEGGLEQEFAEVYRARPDLGRHARSAAGKAADG
ncbi:MAG: sulfotransferase [Xanthomonadaceae bacterium]|nr:sulfotransferase [Xanthomonadaceae bacterium]